MKELFRFGFILALICSIASGLLASVNSLTRPQITLQALIQEKSTLSELFPEAINFLAVKSAEETAYYKVYGRSDKLIGIAFKAEGKGYASNIEIMAGMSPAGVISDIKIISQNETPGLGSRIAADSFLSEFSNKKIEGLKEVQAIAGATISSKAVIDSLRKKAEEVKGWIRNEK